MKTKIFQVDAFSESPFRGNPAAVCLLDEFHSDETLQQIASEMNLSETAFVVQNGDCFDLRWFTPAVEVELCGHATLSAAHVLWEAGVLASDKPAKFMTLSGQLIARSHEGKIELDFPASDVVEEQPPGDVYSILGIENALFFGKTAFDYLVHIEPALELRKLQPDFERLGKLTVRGVMVTSCGDDGKFDFVSRYFAPACGINEDPVTGSAHCALGPYWQGKTGKTSLDAYQASERGGQMRVTIQGDRVLLLGSAITVLTGELIY